MSLAHLGVLFLDELPEYRRDALEVLRQPLEEGFVTLSRVTGSVRFPARFLLVAAMNPCPCGYHGDGSDRCLCDPASIGRYLGRVSGPLLDRMDLRIEVARPPVPDFRTTPTGESSATVARRVRAARAVQRERFAKAAGVFANAHMTARQLRSLCAPVDEALVHLSRYVRRERLSARAYDRTLRVARTIADLAGDERVQATHVGEALQYRMDSASY